MVTMTKPSKLTFLDSLLDAKSLLARQRPMPFISFFYRLNVCVSPKVRMLKPNPQGDGNWWWGLCRWFGHKGGALTNAISALLGRSQRAGQLSLYHTRTEWGQSAAQRKFLTRNWLGRYPDLGLPASRTVRNRSLFKSNTVCGILFQQPEQSKTVYGSGVCKYSWPVRGTERSPVINNVSLE